MKVSVVIRVSAENRWHAQVKVISEEFNKGTPYKGESKIRGCLLLRREKGRSSHQMQSQAALLDWAPTFHLQKSEWPGLKVPGNKHPDLTFPASSLPVGDADSSDDQVWPQVRGQNPESKIGSGGWQKIFCIVLPRIPSHKVTSFGGIVSTHHLRDWVPHSLCLPLPIPNSLKLAALKSCREVSEQNEVCWIYSEDRINWIRAMGTWMWGKRRQQQRGWVHSDGLGSREEVGTQVGAVNGQDVCPAKLQDWSLPPPLSPLSPHPLANPACSLYIHWKLSQVKQQAMADVIKCGGSEDSGRAIRELEFDLLFKQAL